MSAESNLHVRCPLCQNLVLAARDRLGQTVACPVCQEEFLVELPEPASLDTPSTEWLEDPAPSDEYMATSAESESAGQQTDQNGSDEPDAIQRAARELYEEVEEDTEVGESTRRSFSWGAVLRLLQQPEVVLRSFILALALQIEVAAIEGALVRFHDPSPMVQFQCVLFLIFSFMFGLATFLAWSANLLAVLQDTAGGRERIEQWPSANFLDWSADALYIAVPLFLSVLPGLIFAQSLLLITQGSGYVAGTVVIVLLSVVLLFPLLLLSVMEMGSPIYFYSQPVWRSVPLAIRWWLIYDVVCGAAIAFCAALWQLRRLDWMLVDYAVCLVVVVVVFLLFGLLGQLAQIAQHRLGETLEAEQTEAEEDESADLGAAPSEKS